jgi:vesicle coat complex subunit
MSYSENQLNVLAKNNPKELIRIITSPNSDIHALTFGAEILGSEVKDESLVLPALRQLLKHINAVVREGAMIGVSEFYAEAGKKPPQDILDRLKKISTDDPSPACKTCALGLIEGYEK